MAYARPLLEAYPGELNIDADVLSRCIEACYECSQACTACADACLSEENVAELIKCIRLNEDCADVCAVAGRVASRQTEYDANVTRTVVQACAGTCRACGDECERHAAHHEHCRICAEACRRCEAACQELVRAVA
jgi:hypothetical protein